MDDLGEFTKQKSVVSQRLPIPRTGQRVPELCQELRLIALPSFSRELMSFVTKVMDPISTLMKHRGVLSTRMDL